MVARRTEAEWNAIWRAWSRGESRCPHCIDLTCPAEWDFLCDCWLAPEPPDNHICAECVDYRRKVI